MDIQLKLPLDKEWFLSIQEPDKRIRLEAITVKRLAMGLPDWFCEWSWGGNHYWVYNHSTHFWECQYCHLLTNKFNNQPANWLGKKQQTVSPDNNL